MMSVVNEPFWGDVNVVACEGARMMMACVCCDGIVMRRRPCRRQSKGLWCGMSEAR